jgi:hypothetical protein
MKKLMLIVVAYSLTVYGYSQEDKKYRSAKTGQYVTKTNASKHPSTTVSEKTKMK